MPPRPNVLIVHCHDLGQYLHCGQFFQDMGYVTAAVGVIHETRSGAARCGLDEHLPISRASVATDAAIQYLGRFARRSAPIRGDKGLT